MELESCFAHRSPTKQALIMKRIALYDSVLGWLVTAAAEGRLLMLTKHCNAVAPVCWSFQGAHRFHYMALNMAPFYRCMPSLLNSCLEDHFGVFALQTQI